MEIIILPLMLGFCLIYWLTTRPKEEGTLQERRNKPELNTNKLDIHNDRLDKFSKSKYRNTIYYVGARGGYYYSVRGNKVYC